MTLPVDDHRPEGSDEQFSDGTMTPSSGWRDEPAPGTVPDPTPYGSGPQRFENPHPADPYGAGSYSPPSYGQGQPDPYTSQQYGNPTHGIPTYGTPTYEAPTYGAPPYGAHSYDAQLYAGSGYGAQPYGTPAYGAVQPYGQVPPVARKEPALMLVASLIIPGLGTILNGETGKGVGILAGYIVGALLSVILIGLPIMFGFWIWGMVDAYSGAKTFNARHGLP